MLKLDKEYQEGAHQTLDSSFLEHKLDKFVVQRKKDQEEQQIRVTLIEQTQGKWENKNKRRRNGNNKRNKASKAREVREVRVTKRKRQTRSRRTNENNCIKIFATTRRDGRTRDNSIYCCATSSYTSCTSCTSSYTSIRPRPDAKELS